MDAASAPRQQSVAITPAEIRGRRREASNGNRRANDRIASPNRLLTHQLFARMSE